MSQLYEKPLPLGKTGSYTVTVKPEWLGSEAITSQSATVVNGGLTVGLVTTGGNVIQILVTGDTLGRHKIDIEWSTPTRSDCESVYITVENC